MAMAGTGGTGKGKISNVPVDEITWFLVCRMVLTRTKSREDNGILVGLVREIRQFKVFAGKEATDGEEEDYCVCVETLFQTFKI